MGRSNHRARVREKLKNAAVLGSLLLLTHASPMVLADRSVWQESGRSIGQLSIRLVIPEPRALNRDSRGRPCISRRRTSLPVDIQADPGTVIERCNAAAQRSQETVRTTASGIQTFLVKPI